MVQLYYQKLSNEGGLAPVCGESLEMSKGYTTP